MIISHLNAQAEKKGYIIIKEPVSFTLWLIGRITLPVWFDFRWLYISPKHKTRYTEFGLAKKFQEKRERRAQRRRQSLFQLFTSADIHPDNPYHFK